MQAGAPAPDAAAPETPAEEDREEPAAEEAAAPETDGGSCGSGLSWSLADGVLTISGTGEMDDYEAGEAPWYSQRDSIRTVVMKEGITHIGDGAFASCSKMTAVTIPEGVKTIGDYAFSGCAGLKEIALPDSAYALGTQAFARCTGLTSFSLDHVTGFGRMLFYHCTALETVYFGAGTRYSYNCIFTECTALQNIVVDEDNPYLKSVDGILYNRGMTVLYKVPQMTAGQLDVADTVTTLDANAFRGCEYLTGVTIPEGVGNIKDYAFFECRELRQISIPRSITFIGEAAFYGCENLTDVSYGGSAGEWNRLVIEPENEPLEEASFHYGIELPPGVIDGGACGESLTWTFSKDGVLTISGEGAMEDYTSYGSKLAPWRTYSWEEVKRIVVEEGVTSIGKYAFFVCKKTTSLSLPASLTNFPDNAMTESYELERIELAPGNKAYTVRNGVLYDAAMTELVKCPSAMTGRFTVPDGVRRIGRSAFDNCLDLTAIMIPNSVESIAGYAFYGCERIEYITIGKGVTSIGDRILAYNYALKDVYYAGTESEWNAIEIDDANSDLEEVAIHFRADDTPLAVMAAKALKNRAYSDAAADLRWAVG